jgi:glycosyltransferase involved in cell wall biosynthesis
MKRIGIDLRLSHYRDGGISTYAREVLHELARRRLEAQIIAFPMRKDHRSYASGIQHHGLWTPAHHFAERWALAAELFPRKLDLFHSPDFIPPVAGAAAHVITVHDLTFMHYPQYVTPASYRYYNRQIESAVAFADHILVDSEATRLDLVSMLGVDPGRITHHALGVGAHFTPASPEMLQEVRRELALAAEYFLFVGTFEPRKNIIGLLEAYRLLINRHGNATPPLVLVGRRGWLFAETMARAEKLALHDRVLWRENVHDRQLPAVYHAAIALAMPSFYEGFGLPALEAMACGTVPIVSEKSSLPEVTGDVGLLIDPEDPRTISAALERAWQDTDWRKQESGRAIMRAGQFTWQETVDTVLAAYHRALGD